MVQIDKNLIIAGIKALEAIYPNAPDAFDQATAAYKSIGRMPYFIFSLPNLPINVFHSRTHETDDYFKSYSDIALPPAAVVKGYGRCNKPGEPVFYCSDFRPTSYMELLQYWIEEKRGKILHVTIGKWTISNSLNVIIVTSPNPEDRKSKYDIENGKNLDEFMKDFDADTQEALKILWKFLFDRFRKPAKHDLLTYIITSAYCSLAYSKAQIDGILYPSVPAQGDALNIAIKANYDYQNNMKLILVARDSFERIEKEGELPGFQQIQQSQTENLDEANKKIFWLD